MTAVTTRPSVSAGSACQARTRNWRQPTTSTGTMPMTPKRAHMTRTSGEMKNCTTRRAARRIPSRKAECSWRTMTSCRSGEEDRRDHEHRHRDVARDERRDDGGRVAEEQRGREGRGLPLYERAQRDEKAPRAQGGGERERDVGGGDGAPEPSDRGQHRGDEGARGVREQVGAVGDVHPLREHEVVSVREGVRRPGGEPDLLGRISAGAGQGGARVPGPDVPPEGDGRDGEDDDGAGVEGDRFEGACGLGAGAAAGVGGLGGGRGRRRQTGRLGPGCVRAQFGAVARWPRPSVA